jgi:hypothetical protein
MSRKPELCNELCKTSECAAITYGHAADERSARSKYSPAAAEV